MDFRKPSMFLDTIIRNIHRQENVIETNIEQLQNARVEMLKAKGFYALIFNRYGFDKSVFEEDLEKA